MILHTKGAGSPGINRTNIHEDITINFYITYINDNFPQEECSPIRDQGSDWKNEVDNLYCVEQNIHTNANSTNIARIRAVFLTILKHI